MGLNKQKGNMYPWIDYTINFVKGKCPHECSYCYMEKNPSWKNPYWLDDKEFEQDLGGNNTIFVGSSCDMFAHAIPDNWINSIINYLASFPDNTYLFQSKNPKRFYDLIYREFVDQKWNKQIILGTTIETNKDLLPEVQGVSPRVPSPMNRQYWFRKTNAYHKMVSIEPILEFDLDVMVEWIERIKPEFVSIGADSKGHGLPEPSSNDVKQLIKALNQITEVKQKANLRRIYD